MDINKQIKYLINFDYDYDIFITKQFHDEIYRVISDIFLSLMDDHKKIITNSLTILIDIFSTTSNFNFSKFSKSDYFRDIRVDNYYTIRNLLNVLLPDLKNVDKITSLNDIYTTKKEETNIKSGEPEYLFCSVQYARSNRTTKSEVKYKLDYYIHNFLLVINSLISMSNKFYVNWTNILPLNKNDYISGMQFYIDIEKCLINNSFKDVNMINLCDKNEIKKLNHFYIGDIYNILCNDLYKNIKDIKWLIYEILCKSTKDSPKFLPIIYILHKLVNLRKCVQNVSFKDLTKEEAENFGKSISKLKNSAKGSDIVFLNNYETETKSDEFVDNDNVKKIIRYIVLFFDSNYANKRKIDNYLVIEDLKKSALDVILNVFNTIPIGLLYDFFRLNINKLTHTGFYANALIENGDIISGYTFMEDKLKVQYIELNKENALVVKVSLKNIYNFGKSLCHYVKNDKYIMFPEHWESLSFDDRKIIIDRLNSPNNNINGTKWFNITRNISLIYKTLKMPISKETIIKINDGLYNIIRNKLNVIIVYFLLFTGFLSFVIPNQTITSLNDYQFGVNFVSMEKYNEKFFSNVSFNLKTNGTSKAFHWTNQFIFFHHYMNNRVIFITGGTGVGKSTQIPKLLLYAMKLIDKKTTGKIMCSQPRQRPTVSIAERISSELGFEITKDTNTYYIQYKHKDKKFTKNVNYPYILFATDGILLKNVINPILKEKVKKDFSIKNSYDIVIVDEAHEHNKNMDMILTLIKHALYYNNDTKLIIMSATMEIDEKIYRRFYRDINDNKMYPLNYSIKHYGIDRINVDRMFNISSELRFKVIEHYEKNEVSIKDMDETIISRTLGILNNSSVGDILIFESGKAEIHNLIKKLIPKTPENTIILPYLRKLNETQKKLIEKISFQHKETNGEIENYSIDDIKVDKKNVLTSYDYTEGINHYTRLILISTNIAEASITIPTLKYVIDTGTQNIGKYEPDTKSFYIVKTNISEVNRIQRKGRVGRVSSGEVYFMYKKDGMKKNKQKYGINSDDITLNLLDILTDDIEKILMLDDFTKKKIEFVFTDKKMELMFDNKKMELPFGVEYMVKKQYIVNNKYYDYEGNKEHYDYENNKVINSLYIGYTYETIIDELGKFYIIHPDEDIIDRNLFGDIIRVNGTMTNKNLSKKINIYLNELENVNMIKNKVKTNIGMFISELISIFESVNLNVQFAYSLINALSINIYEEFSRFLSIYYAYDEFLLGNFFDVKNYKQFFKLRNVVSIKDGSINTMLGIINDYHNFLKSRNLDMTNTRCLTKENIRRLKINDLITDETFNIYSNDMSSNEIEHLYKSNVFLKIKEKENKNQITEWIKLKKNNISSIFIEKYSSNYMRFVLLDKLIKSTPEYIEIINSMKFNYTDKNIIGLIANIYPSHIIKNISDSNCYLNVLNPDSTILYKIDSIDKFIMNHTYEKGYLLYIMSESETNEVSFVNYIPKEILLKIIKKNEIIQNIFDKHKEKTKDIPKDELNATGNILSTYRETMTLFKTTKHYYLTS